MPMSCSESAGRASRLSGEGIVSHSRIGRLCPPNRLVTAHFPTLTDAAPLLNRALKRRKCGIISSLKQQGAGLGVIKSALQDQLQRHQLGHQKPEGAELLMDLRAIGVEHPAPVP